jgi:hypothetical protein
MVTEMVAEYKILTFVYSVVYFFAIYQQILVDVRQAGKLSRLLIESFEFYKELQTRCGFFVRDQRNANY